MKKTVVSLLLIGVLALSGCSNKSPETQETEETKETGETKKNETVKSEELLEVVKTGTNSLLEVMMGYADDPKIYEEEHAEGSTYYSMKDEFSSYEKIEKYLSPYWSKETIRNIFRHKTRNIDGVFYLLAGDVGITEDFDDVKNVELEEVDDFKFLKVDAALYGGEELEYYPSEHIFIQENDKWVIQDTTFLGGIVAISDEVNKIFNETKQAIYDGELTRSQARELLIEVENIDIKVKTADIAPYPYKLYKGEKHYSIYVMLDSEMVSDIDEYLVDIKTGDIVKVGSEGFESSEFETISEF